MTIDTGMQCFELDGGSICFNPTDPALYQRLEEFVDGLEQLPDTPQEADAAMKEKLNWVLGPGNDVHQALQGVSLLARGSNGKRVLENFMEALMPILKAGLEQCKENY